MRPEPGRRNTSRSGGHSANTRNSRRPQPKRRGRRRPNEVAKRRKAYTDRGLSIDGRTEDGSYYDPGDDGGNIVDRRATEEFQRHVYLIGFHIVDILLVLKVFLQSFHHGWKLGAARDGNGKEGS